ncbi:HAD-IA family hydrolase [Candidatus Micrarchaeota archaeon]|nr:HAD-IA family hydrolase [Candidatus Micrarchaeota archaeon]
MLKFDYWSSILTALAFVFFISIDLISIEKLDKSAFWLLISYLLSQLLLPYFKLYFFREAIIFDFVGVYSAGGADDFYLGEIKERKGMRRLIGSLKRNYKVVLFTNNNWVAHQGFSRKFGLNDLFDFEYASSLIGMKKPGAEAFIEVCRRINVSPRNAVMVDDTLENLTGAKKAGLRAVHFESIEQCQSAFRSMGIKF